MKKAIVTLLVISIITLSTFSVFPSLTAHAASGTSVYETSFESNATGWNSLESEGTITRTTEKAYSGNYSLKMSAHELTWMSPYMNLYNIFKSAGAGTYHFSMYVCIIYG